MTFLRIDVLNWYRLRKAGRLVELTHAIRSARVPHMTASGGGAAGGPDTRLVAYGTLRPGRPNHHQLSDLTGRWLRGRVRGSLVQAGWGAELGYPALVLNEEGAEFEVDVFESSALPEHWNRLDAFPKVPAIAASRSMSQLPTVLCPRRSMSWRSRATSHRRLVWRRVARSTAERRSG